MEIKKLTDGTLVFPPTDEGKSFTQNLQHPTPTIEAVKALDGRLFAMLNASELATLDFYLAQGRKYGVTVTILNKADPMAVAAAKSHQEADQVMKSANNLISVVMANRERTFES